MRPHNRRLLLQLLRSTGPMSRAQLASASGLSPAAVTNVVGDLFASGLVEETPSQPTLDEPTKLGRPGMLVSLARSNQAVLSVQIGSGILQVGVCDLEANILAYESAKFELPTEPGPVLDNAVRMLRRVMKAAGVAENNILGLGVGAAGIVDRTQRINLSSNNLGWVDVEMADYFEKALGVDVVVDHNVRAMAMGEVRYGNGRDLESLAFIYLRSGVGAGLILGGTEYRGGTHGAVELGHVRVVPRGLACPCGGRGCLETVATDSVIRGQLLASVLGTEKASVDRLLGDDWASWFVEAVLAGNERAVRVRDELVTNLASALLNIINIINPQRIVLGGLLSDISDIVLDQLREVIPPQVMPLIRDSISIERATFGSDAGLIGAATVALDRYVFGAPLLDIGKAS